MYGVRWTIQSNYRLAQVSFLNRPCFYKRKFLARSWKLWRRFPSHWLVYRSSIYHFLQFHESFLHCHERLSWKTFMKVFHFRETLAKSGKCFLQAISCFCKRRSCFCKRLALELSCFTCQCDIALIDSVFAYIIIFLYTGYGPVHTYPLYYS